MPDPTLTGRAAFTSLPTPAATGGGVLAVERVGIGIASVLVRKDESAALAQRIRQCFGIELPRGPRRAEVRGIAFAGTGPGAWLATRERDCDGFAAALRDTLGELGSVSDQSGGYAVLHLTGPKLLATLAKLLPLDLHRRAFQPGDVASTVAAQIGTTIWRLDDAAEGLPVFEVVVGRSFAADFWHALCESAAEFGLGIVVPSSLHSRTIESPLLDSPRSPARPAADNREAPPRRIPSTHK